jgi:membrane protein YqaA with SNARE-associated domain
VSAADAEPRAGRVALRFALGATAMLGAVVLVSRLLGPTLEPYAAAFVARWGYPGMALGTFVSDLTTFPVPPQFYMLTAVSAGAPWPRALASIALGSVVGGAGAWRLGGHFERARWIGARVEATRPWVERLRTRYGAWGMVVASLSPIPFSLLCYLTGAYRLGRRDAFIVLVMRVPRLAIFYALIALGWGR